MRLVLPRIFFVYPVEMNKFRFLQSLPGTSFTDIVLALPNFSFQAFFAKLVHARHQYYGDEAI